MKRLPCIVFSLAIFLVPLATSAQEWQAGVATTVITPSEPLWLAGFASRTRPAQETVQDLHLKAIAFRDPEGNRAVILTADILTITLDCRHAVAEAVSKKYGLPPEALLINVSHTHCGPFVRPTGNDLWDIPPEYQAKIAPYVQWLQEQCIVTAGKALADMKPAVVTFSSVAMQYPFSVCRRVPTENGIVFRSTPSTYYTGGPRDDTVPVIRVSAPDGSVRAVLFGYACHPITLNNDFYCGDYPGYAKQYVEEMYPGATALFLQGCGAQLVPNARFQLDYAKGHGRTLAETVKKALDGPQTPLSGPIRYAYREVPLRFAPLPERRVLVEIAANGTNAFDSLITPKKARWLLDQLDAGKTLPEKLPCPLQAISFGRELLLAGFGGETATEYAAAIKAEFPDRFVWAAGYSNYGFGYLPSLKILKEGGYEGGGAFNYTTFPGPFAEDVEDRALGGMREVAHEVIR